MTKPYLRILAPAEGREYSSFYLYLPAAEGHDEYFTEYRFLYEVNPIKPELGYGEGPNDPANRKFYRIRTAYLVKREGDTFAPMFRALQDGEIGFAMKEQGAGDFVGGFHGDEVLTDVSLTVDGRAMPLDTPYFGTFESLEFYEQSYITRCNTPDEHILLHTQRYTVDGNTLRLAQDLEWTADARPIHSAFTPMLTAQRLDPQDLDRILSETVELLDGEGNILAQFDTTDYGRDRIGSPSDSVCLNTPATAVRVYGKESGFMAEAGYTVREGIPPEHIKTYLCIRHMRGAVDNKIYFDIARDTAPKKGDAWRSDIYYRVTYGVK